MAVKFLTQDWLDKQKELAQEFPERPGATARMQYVVTGAPDGDVSFYTVVENGNMKENQIGQDPDGAEFTMTVGYADFEKISKGELDANAAFMQGRLKVTGNMAKLMSLMPLTQSPEYKAIAVKLHGETDYGNGGEDAGGAADAGGEDAGGEDAAGGGEAGSAAPAPPAEAASEAAADAPSEAPSES